MSQKKVDRYKQEKANRAQIMKKEKLMHRLEMTAVMVVLVALVGWFGFSVYDKLEETRPVKEYAFDTTSLDNYINGLSADEEATADDTTEGEPTEDSEGTQADEASADSGDTQEGETADSESQETEDSAAPNGETE